MAKHKDLTIRQIAAQYGIEYEEIPHKGPRPTWEEFEDFLEQHTAAINAANQGQ